MPPKKFITLNFRCGENYVNADWIYSMVFSYYITKFNLKSCRHVSLSVGAFTTLLWKFAYHLYPEVEFEPLSSEELALIQDFIANGAGLIYDETTNVVDMFPETTTVTKRLNPIPEFPELSVTRSFEDFVNAACRRMTGAYNPFTGVKETEDPNKRYGIDAVHAYLMRVGSPPVQHRAIIRRQSLVNWVAAKLLGVERGEFGGLNPFGPNILPQDLNKDNPPEMIWLDSYVADFAETPFYWICGLLTFIPIKNIGEYDDGDVKPEYALTNLDEVRYDAVQVNWCYPSLVTRAQWLLNYLKNVSPIDAKRVGAYITSKACHAVKTNWMLALETPGKIVPHYEKFKIPTGTHSKPANIAEAHLANSEQGDVNGVYGAWMAEFEAWLDYIAQYWMTDSDIVLFSDREAKEMVVQQYDPDNPITVDEDRVKAIVDVLIDLEPETRKWQIGENEWNLENPINVTRPPDYVKITIDEEDEYYTLSEAYWHILSALNDIANEEENIDYKTMELVLGPSEPNICAETSVPEVPEDDSVYRVFVWWQNNALTTPTISADEIIANANSLFIQAITGLVGPTFPASPTRQVNLRKIVTFWNIHDINGNTIKTNCAEMLYLMAKTLDHYYHPNDPAHPDSFTFLPSHVLPKGYYKFLLNGRFKLIFGDATERQLNWLDLGQRWTMKPAVLTEAYR
jgi:hypothetical protein